MRKLRLTPVAVLAAMATMTAAAGTATGSFTVNAKPTKLAFSYAKVRSNNEVKVILSDVAVPQAALDDPSPFGLQDLTKAGKLHGIAFIVNADKQVISTSMYDPQFKMSSVSVAGSHIKFDATTLNTTTIAGKLYTTKVDDFNDVTYEYAVTFTAPIAR